MILALLACGDNCEVDGPLDYDGDANWICHDGVGDSCPERVPLYTVHPDGTGTAGEIVAAVDPPLACFVLYPTLALGLGARIQDDVNDREDASQSIRRHYALFAESCTIYAPFYRQATLGNFIGKTTDRKRGCLDTAYEDVRAAFDAFLVAEPTRDFVLIGHSQGGIHFERLIDEVIEEDPALAARMVAAYPIGTGISVSPNSENDASFDRTPICDSPEQRGCVVAYRTFVEGRGRLADGDFLRGDEGVCVNPANPADGATPTLLAAFSIPADHSFLEEAFDQPGDTLLVWEQAFEARCEGPGKGVGLEVTWVRSDAPPFDLDAKLITGTNGSHAIDLNLTEFDLRIDVARRAGLR